MLTDTHLDNLKNAIANSYKEWSLSGPEDTRYIREQMYNDYVESIRFEHGKNYIKVVCNNSAWGFIVKVPTKGFVVGDILKAASWKAPATNFRRGNLITEPLVGIRWTGAM